MAEPKTSPFCGPFCGPFSNVEEVSSIAPLPRAALLLLLAAGPARAAEDLPQYLARDAAAGDAIGAARACGMEKKALDPVSTAYIRRIALHPPGRTPGRPFLHCPSLGLPAHDHRRRGRLRRDVSPPQGAAPDARRRIARRPAPLPAAVSMPPILSNAAAAQGPADPCRAQDGDGRIGNLRRAGNCWRTSTPHADLKPLPLWLGL
jgi:hypothetical protein